MHPEDRFAYRFEGFCLDPVRRLLWNRDRNRITLNPKTFDVLLYLVGHPGELLERQHLLEAVWPRVIVQENNLEQAVSTLRRALGEKRNDHRFIVTEPGRGYRFVARVETISVDETPEPVRAPEPLQGRPLPETAAGELRVSFARRLGSPGPYWLAAAMICATIIVTLLLTVQEPVPDASGVRLTPWSLLSGGQRSAVWSPDGRSIAFVARNTADEPYRLYVRAIDSKLATPIPLALTNPIVKQWTTDGRLVLMDNSNLWSVPPTGGEPQLIANIDTERYYDLSDQGFDVTRDGSAVATFGRSDDGSFTIFTATLPDADFEKYEPAPFESGLIVNRPFLRFSPDGSQLLVLRNDGNGEQVWLLPFPSDTRRPPHVVLEALPVSATPQVSWLPDNRHVVFSTAPKMRRELFVADIESGEFSLLSTGESNRVLPVVSPNGDTLVYTDSRDDFDIVTLDLQSATTTPVVATRQMELMPTWADNADELAYVTDRTGALEIWVRTSDGADRPLVTARDFLQETQWLMAPALSPDGERVIYQNVEAPRASASRLWMSPVAGGSPVRVTNDDVGLETAGSWSPDGAWYVYAAIQPDRSIHVMKVRTSGRAVPETLVEDVHPGSPAVVPVWSSDGDWILVADEGMKLVPADGGAPRSLGIEAAPCAFDDSEELIYCIREAGPDGEHPLVALNFDGEIVRMIGSIPHDRFPATPLNPSLRLSLTPDGSGVTYAIHSTSQDLWLMDGISQFASR